MAYVRNEGRIKLIPEECVLLAVVLWHDVFLHVMRVRRGYWRRRRVTAWRGLSADDRVQQMTLFVLPRANSIVSHVLGDKGGLAIKLSGKIGGHWGLLFRPC